VTGSVDADEALARAVAYARALSEWTPVPGGVIGIVSRDGLLAAGSWGLAEVASGVPMRLDHRFEIGSISKVTTAILVHRLVDEGLLDLDRPVVDDLPWLAFGEPQADVTPRHLLSHTAGLVLGADAVPDELAQLWSMRWLQRSGEPGERFHYSNLGFMALGILAAQVADQPFPELVRRRVLDPIGMRTARPVVRHADRASMATGHCPLIDDQSWVPGDPVTAATWFEVGSADGNVAASADELGRLASYLLGDGAPVLSSQSLQRLVSPAAPGGEGVLTWGPTPTATSSRYGLGINVEQISGHHCVTHGGGMVGYATFLLADRDAGVGVVVLTNGSGEHPAAHVIARVAHRLLLDPAWNPPSASAQLDASELPTALLGTFAAGTPDGAELQIEVTADEVGAVSVSSGGHTGPLLRTWGDRYVSGHAGLRGFALTPGHGVWYWGGSTFRPAGAPVTTESLDERWSPFVGHYRSWSPWFTQLRIVARGGHLALIAPGGVEAPSDDMRLIEVSPGTFRVGDDPWLPERVQFGPQVNGRCISLTRDGCVYSRTFTD
jgi:D-alanyl-D-alanine carboxypeptidase